MEKPFRCEEIWQSARAVAHQKCATKLMKELDYGKGYKYSPNFGYKEDQKYMPEELKGRKYLDFGD